MAMWDRILSRGNVEDRRAMGPVAVGGSLGVGGLILIMALTYLSGGDITDVLRTINPNDIVQTRPTDTSQFQGQDNYEVFASTVLGSNNDIWNSIFQQGGQTYNAPRLVLFRTATYSGCGTATSEVGPHYCPLDSAIYLDETFFDELTHRFGAQGGDVAQAYVIAHEVGHHVQNQLGIMEQVDTSLDSNQQSVRLELQADCFAGIWANSIKSKGILEPGEIREAIDAAAAVGDDRIQEKVTGQISPETWTHGSSDQRVSWFNRGFESGSPDSCDTFK